MKSFAISLYLILLDSFAANCNADDTQVREVCGPRAVMEVLQHYGVACSLEELTEKIFLGTESKHSSMDRLAACLEEYGVCVCPVSIPSSDDINWAGPSIVHIAGFPRPGLAHFAVFVPSQQPDQPIKGKLVMSDIQLDIDLTQLLGKRSAIVLLTSDIESDFDAIRSGWRRDYAVKVVSCLTLLSFVVTFLLRGESKMRIVRAVRALVGTSFCMIAIYGLTEPTMTAPASHSIAQLVGGAGCYFPTLSSCAPINSTTCASSCVWHGFTPGNQISGQWECDGGGATETSTLSTNSSYFSDDDNLGYGNESDPLGDPQDCYTVYACKCGSMRAPAFGGTDPGCGPDTTDQDNSSGSFHEVDEGWNCGIED